MHLTKCNSDYWKGYLFSHNQICSIYKDRMCAKWSSSFSHDEIFPVPLESSSLGGFFFLGENCCFASFGQRGLNKVTDVKEDIPAMELTKSQMWPVPHSPGHRTHSRETAVRSTVSVLMDGIVLDVSWSSSWALEGFALALFGYQPQLHQRKHLIWSISLFSPL